MKCYVYYEVSGYTSETLHDNGLRTPNGGVYQDYAPPTSEDVVNVVSSMQLFDGNYHSVTFVLYTDVDMEREDADSYDSDAVFYDNFTLDDNDDIAVTDEISIFDQIANNALELFSELFPNALKRVMLTQEPDGFGVCVVTGDTTNLVWSGLLEDAIITAANTAEETDAANVDAWREFESIHVGSDMDELAVALVKIHSAEEYRWMFDPAQSGNVV